MLSKQMKDDLIAFQTESSGDTIERQLSVHAATL